MSNKNPCIGCPNAGCGNHANCEAYMEYFRANRERDKLKVQQSDIASYTMAAIRDVSRHRKKPILWRKYTARQKEKEGIMGVEKDE